MIKLTKRLAAAAALVIPGGPVADIGTDHGYIPVALCESGSCPSAIAADVAPGPLSAASAHVRQAGLADRIDCRLGNGLQCLQPHEVSGVVICGMGGPLMIRILEDSPAVLEALHFMVLQPQSGAAALRRYLYEKGWHIDEEALVYEEGRLYEILRALPGEQEALPDWLYEIGPVNWQRQEPLVLQQVAGLVDRKRRILEGLQKSAAPLAEQIAELQGEIKDWEERICQYKCSKSST